MGNVILTPDMITREAMRVFENKLVLTRNCNRQYDSSFANEGAKIGSVLRIRKPDRALVTDGAVLQVQDESQQNTTLTVTNQKHIGLAFTSAELTMSIDDFSKLIIEPRMSQLAASVDADVALGVIKQIGQSVGTAGTTPATTAVLLAAQQKLNESAVPMNDRIAIVNPAANAALVEGMKGLFNPGNTVGRQFKDGLMGAGVLGYGEISMSQSIASFTTGTRVAATVTTTIAAEGATTVALTISGGTATDTIKTGDVFTIGSVFAVNPQTRQSTGSLFQFVALADATAVANAITVTVAPIYTAAHALATVNAFPVASATITFTGAANTAYPQNIVFQKDAIAFATADLVKPKGMDMVSQVNHEGISMRFVRGFDIVNDRMITRVDVLYGFGVIRPEGAVRLWG